MSEHIGGHKGPINHSLGGPALLLCSTEAWRLVRQCRPCSAFLSINSCFTSSLQLSLTRAQICFQLSVTHSSIQTLLFGIWFLSLSISLFSPSGSFFPSLLPFCLCSTRSQFNSSSLSQHLQRQSYIISPLSHPLLLRSTVPQGLTIRACNTCWNSRSLEEKEDILPTTWNSRQSVAAAH